jgi:hypothetical protein
MLVNKFEAFSFIFVQPTTLQSFLQRKIASLSGHHALEAGHVTLLGSNLEVSVDDTANIVSIENTNRTSEGYLRDSHKNTGTAAESAHQITDNGESTNAGTTESGGSWDNALELTVHALITVTGHNHTLLLELLGNVTRAGARNFDPGLGEGGTCDEHVGGEDGGVDRVEKSVGKVERRTHIVDEAAGRENLSAALTSLPDTKHLDEKVVGELVVKHLAEKEDVGGEGGLKHDRHVRGVEKADGVGAAHATLARRLDGDLNAEAWELC